jgi:phosphohistidine phosphatase
MILYVLRHGIAEDAGPSGGDRDRRLTSRGRARLQRAAAGMQALGLGFDVLLTSPYARAAETAAVVAAVLGDGPTPRELPELAQEKAPAEILRALRPFARRAHVAIVGHEPGLSGVVALLLTGSAEGMGMSLKKGGMVALEVRAVQPGAATLLWALTPRQLRRLAR